MMHPCPHCRQSLNVYKQHCKPARINGEIVYTSFTWQAECRNPNCPRRWITRELSVLLAMTDAQAAEYQTEVC